MSENKYKRQAAQNPGAEAFVSRWSRLKQQANEPPAARPAAPDPDAPPPALPPLEDLTIDSDFSAYFHPKIDPGLRRAALKKLFSDPHFNVMDGLDVYIDDYSKPNPLPAALLGGLRQAQKILEWAKETGAEAAQKNSATSIAKSPPLQHSDSPQQREPQPTEERRKV